MDEDDVIVKYARRDDMVRMTLQNLSNHELREILVGLWARLKRDDQVDHIRELQAYLAPGSWLSPIARALEEGEVGESAIDLKALIASEWKVR